MPTDAEKNIEAPGRAAMERLQSGRGTRNEQRRDTQIVQASRQALATPVEQGRPFVGREMPLDNENDTNGGGWILSRVFKEDNFGLPLEHAFSNLPEDRRSILKEAAKSTVKDIAKAVSKFAGNKPLDEADVVRLHALYQDIGILMGEKNLAGPLTEAQKNRMVNGSRTIFRRLIPQSVVEQAAIGVREGVKKGMVKALQNRDPQKIIGAYVSEVENALDEGMRAAATKRLDFVFFSMKEAYPQWAGENKSKVYNGRVEPGVNESTELIYERNRNSQNELSPISKAVFDRSAQIFQMGFNAYFDSLKIFRPDFDHF